MCAICGIVRPGAGGERDRVERAAACMVHRGPDDGGVWPGIGICLGARRLAIIDRSAAGHQPMTSDDAQHVIVFNGEIYNFQRLRAELEPTCRFIGHSDTEVLLHGVRTWGFEGTVRRAHGQFALAVWDAAAHTLRMARDRAGKKPLFYAHDGESFAFASTLNAVLELLPQRPQVDPRAIDAYLTYQAVPAPMSVWQGVKALPPAHWLSFDAGSGRCDVTRYWDVSYATKTSMDEPEVLAEVERIARRAVRDRLVADRTVGIFLSGGVDSSLITALAAEESATPIEAVAVGFDDPEFDERPFARRVASHLGVTLHERVLRPDVVNELPGIVWHYGQPLADVSMVPSHDLSRVSRDIMVVALNGDGGDELFGGYTRPMVARAAERYRRLMPASLRRAADGVLHERMSGPLKKATLLARAGRAAAIDTFTYDRGFREYRDVAYTPEFLGTIGDYDPDALYRDVWARADGTDDVDRALYGDFSTYFPDQLLAKADVASMAHSLEARSPLLDTEMIEFAATIPTDIRLRGWETKHVLKRLAGKFVPREVLYRRKRGFVMPASRWLRGALAPHVRAALDSESFHDRGWVRPDFTRRLLDEHLGGAHDWGDQLFTLLVLEIWARLAIDGTLQRTDPLDALRRGGEARGAVQRPLRTLQVGMEWFSEEPGGLNRVYLELVNRLPTQGVQVSGLVAGSEVVARESGGRVVGVAPHIAPIAHRLFRLRGAAAAQFRADPDTVLVAHFALYAAPLLGLLRNRRRPFVFHFHGPWAQETFAEHVRGVMPRLKARVERAVYQRADACIVLSSAFGKILHDSFDVPWEKIHVIPGGVDCDRFAISATRAACRERLGWPADRPIVLAVRRLTHRMGLGQLIAAVATLRRRVPDVLVLIAGRGPIEEELRAQIRRAQLEEHCRLVGFIAEDDLPTAYRAADLTIVPSVALEGYGLIVPESLAAGTPVLVTPVGGLRETVDGLGEHLVLSDASAIAIAQGLGDALTGAVPMPTPDECRAYARRRNDWPV
ncbi:MAG: asparagine synthase (glutamine-hydrolyzing), partial [Gemmatimonadetes bacterium]|nr:asparagine synthase (glutamine-hydrolyzing) [Gemmatimonadota bacterium]